MNPLETQLHRIQDYAEDTPHIGTLSTLRRIHELTHLLQKIQQIMIRREENNPKPNLDNLLEIHLLEIGALCWKWGNEIPRENDSATFIELIQERIESDRRPSHSDQEKVFDLGHEIAMVGARAEHMHLDTYLCSLLGNVMEWLAQEKEKETQK